MTPKQIQKFIEKIGGEDVIIKYYYDSSINSVISRVKIEKIKKIEINRYWLKKVKENILKVALLHEVGHLEIGIVRPQYMWEYLSQLWAIKKAKRLKMYNIARKAARILLKDWGHNWSKKYFTCYKKAYDLAQKNKKKIVDLVKK